MYSKKTKSDSALEPRDEPYRHWVFTVPNVICILRLFGSFVLLGLAIVGWPSWFVALFVLLTLSDWIDGRLARWLHQRSDLGARLDSTADAIMYAALIGGASILCWEQLRHEWIWLAVGVGSYALTSMAGIVKYGRVPSYHTYGAKATQWIASIAGVSLVLGWSVWPLRIASIAVTLTNLEATALTCVLKTWQADVLTLFHVWPRARKTRRTITDQSNRK